MMITETTKKIGIRLHRLRSQRGFTQAAVAKMAGISANYYARIERGDTRISLEIFEKLAKALKVRSSDILPF